MRSHEYIGNILGVSPDTLASVDAVMRARTGQAGVMEDLMRGNEERMSVFLEALGITARNAADMRAALYRAVVAHEQQLLRHLETVPGETQLEKAAALAKRVVQVGTGYFLKREYAKEILRKKKPEHLLEYLGCRDVEEVFRKVDVMEAFSALRFVETNEWMHAAFEDAYSAFTARDFEERQIDVRVLGPEWKEVAEKFVAKKHHNVSHLKEFGVIFLNPIREDVPGKFLRDFALFLHYFHEIEFYAKLFRAYAKENDFPERFKALLRGDVKEIRGVGEAEWLIVQRYLFKENPRDPRLFLPRVNPESLHWKRAERDLVHFGEKEGKLHLELWRDLDWVGGFFSRGKGEVVSFDLEDNAMSAVSFALGEKKSFTYHQREAMWTEMCVRYAGGEGAMEELLLENFSAGLIRF